MEYTEEELHEAAEVLVKAEEIRNDRDLMKELEPFMKDRMMTIDKVLSLKELWNKAKTRLAEEDYKEEMDPLPLGEKEHAEAKRKREEGKLVNTTDDGESLPRDGGLKLGTKY